MRKIGIFALALLAAVLVCSCDPDANGMKKPPLGYSFDEERQFLRLTDGGNEPLTVFHLLLKGEEAYYHIEKEFDDFHEYTNLYEEFEWAFENIGLEATGTFAEDWIRIEGRVDSSTYEAFIFCSEENAVSMAAKIAGGETFAVMFERTDVESGRYFDPNCRSGVRFQTVTARRGY